MTRFAELENNANYNLRQSMLYAMYKEDHKRRRQCNTSKMISTIIFAVDYKPIPFYSHPSAFKVVIRAGFRYLGLLGREFPHPTC